MDDHRDNGGYLTDRHVNAVIVAALIIGLTCIAIMGGLLLKQGRRHQTAGISNGCYKWSDGHTSCQGRP